MHLSLGYYQTRVLDFSDTMPFKGKYRILRSSLLITRGCVESSGKWINHQDEAHRHPHCDAEISESKKKVELHVWAFSERPMLLPIVAVYWEELSVAQAGLELWIFLSPPWVWEPEAYITTPGFNCFPYLCVCLGERDVCVCVNVGTLVPVRTQI